jgi:hypothetical protein
MFHRSHSANGSYGVWALLLGSITAMIQFFLGNLITPGGFGFSRFLFGFIDIVSLPVLLPLLVYLIIIAIKRFSCDINFANFALLWLIPIGALRALSWSSTNDPILLIMAPLIWTALAVGIPFFVDLMRNNFSWHIAVLSIFCILLMPVLACAAYWAFFSQLLLLGYGLLLVSYVPLVLSTIFAMRNS